MGIGKTIKRTLTGMLFIVVMLTMIPSTSFAAGGSLSAPTAVKEFEYDSTGKAAVGKVQFTFQANADGTYQYKITDESHVGLTNTGEWITVTSVALRSSSVLILYTGHNVTIQARAVDSTGAVGETAVCSITELSSETDAFLSSGAITADQRMLITYAMNEAGKPYVYAAGGPDAYDCSGFVQAVYKKMGITIPRVSGSQATAGTEAEPDSLQPGDILCFASTVGGTSVSHVGIYLGYDKFIHAPRTGDAVRIATLEGSYRSRLVTARRFLVSNEIGAFVSRMYELALGRTAGTDEINYYVNLLSNRSITGADVSYGFLFSPEFINRALDNEAYVKVLYQTMMNREADAGGLDHWIGLLNGGVSREYVFQSFVMSAEYTGICDSYGIDRGDKILTDARSQNPGLTMFVSRMYTEALGREAETAGLEYYADALLNGRVTPVQAAQNFMFSPEFENKNLSDEAYVKILYRTFMGRDYDQGGLDYHLDRMANGTGRADILYGFAYSPEFQGIIASFGLK